VQESLTTYAKIFAYLSPESFRAGKPSLLVLLRHDIVAVESAVISQVESAVSSTAQLDRVLELLRKLMEYRSDEACHRLEN
jgi:hypothetical protein